MGLLKKAVIKYTQWSFLRSNLASFFQCLLLITILFLLLYVFLYKTNKLHNN